MNPFADLIPQSSHNPFSGLTAPQPKQPGLIASAVKPLYQIGAETGAALTQLGGKLANSSGDVTAQNKSITQLNAMQTQVLNKIKEKTALGQDTSKLTKILVGTIGKTQSIQPTLPSSINSDTFGKTNIYTDPLKQTGVGLQAVGLGLGPVGGGAAIFGGQALEEGKPILPTFQGNGIVDKTKNLLTDNALGEATLGAATGKILGKTIGLTGTVVSGLGSLLKGVGGGSEALIRSAISNYEKVLAPTTKINKTLTQKVAPELANRQVFALSRSSLADKAATESEIAADVVDQQWKNLPKGTKIDTNSIHNEIIKQLEELRIPAANGSKFVNSENQAEYQALVTKLEELSKLSDLNGMADAESLRAWRQSLDSSIAKNKSAQFAFSPNDTAKLGATKTAANETRGAISKQQPQIGAANKEFNFWNSVKKVVDSTIERKTGQSTGLGEKIATGAGIAGGLAHGLTKGIEFGIAMKYVTKLFQSTAFQTGSAVAKAKLAQAIQKGEGVLVIKTILNGFKLTGTGLEGLGKFLKGTVPEIKNLQKTPIKAPETLKNFEKKVQDTPNRQGGFIGLGAKNIHPDDKKVMETFIDNARVGTSLSDVQFSQAEKLAQKFGISMDKGLSGVANEFDKILSGQKKVTGTALSGSVKNNVISEFDSAQNIDTFAQKASLTRGKISVPQEIIDAGQGAVEEFNSSVRYFRQRNKGRRIYNSMDEWYKTSTSNKVKGT